MTHSHSPELITCSTIYILLFYVTLLGTLIILTGRIQLGHSPNLPTQASPWSPLAILQNAKPYYVPALHFLFGSLFSAYAIVYSHSASLSTSAVFLGIIVIVLVLNEFWRESDDVIRGEGPAYCFISVFAPVSLETTIYHHWQHRAFSKTKSGEKRPFHTTDRIPINISGGRQDGYRSYTVKQHLNPGEWQVTVETKDERIIGKTTFLVEPDAREFRRLETLVY